MAGNAKGTLLIAANRFLTESFGKEGLEKVIARLAPEERERLEPPLLPSAWYPLSLLLHLMRAAKDEFGAAMPDIFTKMGRASVDYSISSVYSMVFKVGSTKWIISRSPTVFSSYYDTGKMSVTENGNGFATIEVVEFGEPAPEFCERIGAWCTRILEHCGAKNVRVDHTACVCRGNKSCQYKATWT